MDLVKLAALTEHYEIYKFMKGRSQDDVEEREIQAERKKDPYLPQPDWEDPEQPRKLTQSFGKTIPQPKLPSPTRSGAEDPKKLS